MKSLFFISLLLITISGFGQSDEEFVGPFSSWYVLKGGDGITDETTIIQKALDSLSSPNRTFTVVFLSKGVHRITKSLNLKYCQNISLIGEDPVNTILKWDGPAKGSMIVINGVANSKFDRITFDGNNIAGNCVNQSWDALQPNFDTGNEYADDVFENTDVGIRGGFLEFGFAETSILRCKFINNTVVGVALGNWNALDIWVWDCLFENCGIGISNEFGAGNFRVYHSNFHSSKIADITIGNTGEFSFRDNTSTNSNMFFNSAFTWNPAPIIFQGNVIIDPKTTPIVISNQGPITMLDNIIRYSGSPVISSYCNLLSLGNTFTSPSPYEYPWGIFINDKIVSSATLSGLTEPTLPSAPPNLNRTIFEVPVGANQITFQGIINQAAKLIGQKPVVHIPYGSYDADIIIPSCDLQLIGDGFGDEMPTWINGSITIQGPSAVNLKDFSINGLGTKSCLTILNCDQPGGRVFGQQVHMNGNNINLSNTLNSTNTLFENSVSSTSSTGMSINGKAKTIFYAGAESDNNISHEVTNGGNLLIRDVWYESIYNGKYANLTNGNFTTEGSHITYPTDNTQTSTLNNFNGKATLFGNNITHKFSITGNGANTNFLATTLLAFDTSFVNNTSTGSKVIIVNNRGIDTNSATSGSGSFESAVYFLNYLNTYFLNKIKDSVNTFFNSMLSDSRSVHYQPLVAATPTDVRMNRVWLYNGSIGIALSGSVSPLPVIFSSFTSKCLNGKTELTWITEQENNSDKFAIEQSEDGIQWKDIGYIKAAMYSTTKTKYTYLAEGSGFYRIKEIDINGEVTYTSILESSCTQANYKISIYPNPVIDNVTISIFSLESKKILLAIEDDKGSTIKNMEFVITEGTNNLQINLSPYSKGIYYFRITQDKNIYVAKIIKN